MIYQKFKRSIQLISPNIDNFCCKKPTVIHFVFSCDALCKLLLHAITTGDGRFEEIVVPGDDINDSQGKTVAL